MVKTTPLMDIQGLSLQRSGSPVLTELNLCIQRGEFVGLIGPNGAGKTSLLRCISTHLQADSGRCLVDGLDASAALAYRRSFGSAMAPEDLPADLSPRQLLSIVAAARELEQIPEQTLALAESFGLSRWLDRSIGNCSLGARQKTGLLTGMLGQPPLLIFDEPFNGLDPLAAFEFKRTLGEWTASGSCGVLLATHGIEVAERLLDKAVLLLNGRIEAQWTRAQLTELRAEGMDLESAMVQRLRDHAAPA